MRNLAVFWHGKISGGTPPVSGYARHIMAEQMDLLVSSGLYEACHDIVIGLNQNKSEFVNDLLPPGVRTVFHGEDAQSELPTLCCLQEWLPAHRDWFVCYFHCKGARHGADPLNIAWRRCMERCVIQNWRRCVRDLEQGYATVGAHWLTPQRFGSIVKSPFWGGNFWWARADFLIQLPKLFKVPKDYNDFYAAENWIGTGPLPPVRDYAPHWPNLQLCSKTR